VDEIDASRGRLVQGCIMTEPIDPTHENAVRIADLMEGEAAALGIQCERLANGTRLIDAGVRAPGSLEAGRLFAEACLGGLGRVTFAERSLGTARIQEARTVVDRPLRACIGSQYAGWRIRKRDFFGMGSGPARSLAAAEPLFDLYPLKSSAARSVLLLECGSRPEAEVAAMVAARCGLEGENLTLVIASTGSLVGTIQIAARSVETALHKLMEIGFDLNLILAGSGACPVAPGHPDPIEAIGRTNDAILYGAEVSLRVRAGDAALEAAVERVPSSASRDHGRLFVELFRERGGDFYAIDPLLFSPARVTLINDATGRIHSAGRPD